MSRSFDALRAAMAARRAPLRSAALALAAVLAACAPAPAQAPVSTPARDASAWDAVEPVWDNGRTQAAREVRIFVEPYCQAQECRAYIEQALPALIALPDARVRIYDYPLSQAGESYMVAGIGRCIAQQSRDLYPAYLAEAARSTALKDELEMYRVAKLVAGKRYDTRCLQREIGKLKAVFDNRNPLGFSRLPATCFGTSGGPCDLVEGGMTADQARRMASSSQP
jgi:hypothetical protein